MKRMNIIYFADGPWAHLAFKRILEMNIEIALMVLRYETRDEILLEKAKENDIACTWVENVNDPTFLEKLHSCSADLGVSMSFNQIFKKDLIELFPSGLINCHAGKLPYYRGRNVLNWALINGEDEIGVTCHYVDEGVDTGDIIYQETFPVSKEDDYQSILMNAFEVCAHVLSHSLDLIRKDKVNSFPQPEHGTYFIGRKVGDEFIDWSWSSERIYNFVRAITYPGPYAQSWIEIGNKYEIIYIKKVNMIQNAFSYISVEGGIAGKSNSGNPLVKTGDSFLEITDYEIDHYKKKKLFTGDRLGLNADLNYLWEKMRG